MRGTSVFVLACGCSFHTQSGVTGDDASTPHDVAIDMRLPDGPVTGPRRKSITIHKEEITGMVPAFPVWIDLTDPDLEMRAQPDGSDIFFTDAANAPIPYERRWNAGHLMAWVKLDLDHAHDTVIYVRYGDPTNVPAPDPAGVFANGFAAVWHLDDSLVATAVADATGTHDGTAQAGLDADNTITGKLGGAFDFDGSAKTVHFANMFAGNTPHTVSAWVNQRNANGFDTVFVVGNNSNNHSRWFYTHYTSPSIAVGYFGNDWDDPGIDVEGGGWTLLHWVYEAGTARMNHLYRDGRDMGMFATDNGSVNTQGSDGYLGWAPIGWGNTNGMNGSLDEVRVATMPRTPAWIATEYANQSDPASFYAVGGEEPAP